MSIKHKRKLEEKKTNAIFDKICKQLPPKTDTTAKTWSGANVESKLELHENM